MTSSNDIDLVCPSGNDITKVYDATPLTATATASGVGNDVIKIEYSTDNENWSTEAPSITNVDEELVYVRASNDNYDTAYCQYTLEVTCKKVTITANDASREYNGSALTEGGFTASALETGDTHTFTVVMTEESTITNVGTQANVIATVDGVAVTTGVETAVGNYCVTTANGELEVTSSNDIDLVCPSGEDLTKIYDGTELKPAATATGVQADDVIKVEYSTDEENWSETVSGITHVGDLTVYVRASNANYDTAYCEYKLKVTCRSITLTSATDEKEYNGTALTNNTVTLTGDGFVEGEGYTTEVTGSQTLVGESENTFTYALNDGTQAVDYCIETVNGTLTVTANTTSLTIVSATDSKEYDGTALTAPTYTVTYGDESGTATLNADGTYSYELSTGDEIVITPAATATVTHVSEGTVTNAFSYTLENAEFYSNVTTEFGTLTILPIDVTVTITEHSDEVDYDGEEHTVSGYDVSISNPLYTEADFTFSGDASVSGTNAGSYSMDLSADDFENTNPNFANVTFTIVDAGLVIDPVSSEVVVTIVGNSDSHEYDGDEYSVSGYVITNISNPLYTEADFTKPAQDAEVATAARTEEGTTTMLLSASDFVNISENFTNVVFNVTPGTMEITPRINIPITFNLDTTKVYDGTPFVVTAEDLLSHTEGLQEGHQLVSGTIVSEDYIVGTYQCEEGNFYATKDILVASKIGFKIEDENNEDVTSRYIPSFHVTLRIVQRPITITAGSNEKPYDGLALTDQSFDLTSTMSPVLADGDNLDNLVIDGSQLCVGESSNIPSNATIIRTTDEEFPMGRDVTSSYNIKYLNGGLTVTDIENAISCLTPEVTITLPDFTTEITVDLEEPTLNVPIEAGMYQITNNLTSNKMGLGEHTVVWTITDNCGNVLSTSCSQIVTVEYAPCEPVIINEYITYDAVRIGSQCWLAENLRQEQNAYGQEIAYYRPFNDNPANVENYGYLYSWYSAVGVPEGDNTATPVTMTDEFGEPYVQGICPIGWALPSRSDVNILRAAIEDDARSLMDDNAQFWLQGYNGTNTTGFNGRGTGLYNGRFERYLTHGYFWEAEANGQSGESVLSVVLSYYCSTVLEEISPKNNMRPVRCVRKVTPGL